MKNKKPVRVYHAVLISEQDEKTFIDFISTSVEKVVAYMKVAWVDYRLESIIESVGDIIDIVDGHIEGDDDWEMSAKKYYDEETNYAE